MGNNSPVSTPHQMPCNHQGDQGGQGHGDLHVTVLTQQNAPSPSQPAKQDAPTTQTTRSHCCHRSWVTLLRDSGLLVIAVIWAK